MVTVKAKTKEFLQTLRAVREGVPRTKAKAKATSCEITVTDGKITFAVPGAVFSMPCTTQGTCKATIKFLYFLDLIKSSTSGETEIVITEGQMKVGPVTVKVPTTFFRDDAILRTIDLPINYTDGDLLRLNNSGLYTEQELRFNKLFDKILQAEINLKNNITAAYYKLRKFGVTHEEVEEMTHSKVYYKVIEE